MKETTIEDVLKKHLDAWQKSEINLDEHIKAAMTEWASLNRQGCRWTKALDFLNKLKDLIKRYNKQTGETGVGNHVTNEINEYLATIEPCATSSRIEELEKGLEKLKLFLPYEQQSEAEKLLNKVL